MSDSHFDTIVQGLGSWTPFFIQHKFLITNILQTIIDAKISIFPTPQDVFRIFYEISINEIRVVIVGDEPIISSCSFFIPRIISSFLKSSSNVCRDKMLSTWISQGVFPMNMAWTIGYSDCEFQSSHLILWEEFSRKLIQYIQHHSPDSIFLLLDKKAWVLTEHIPKYRIIQQDAKDFLTCFDDVNNLLSQPIYWNSILYL
jgi:uracil DNA glycosylase